MTRYFQTRVHDAYMCTAWEIAKRMGATTMSCVVLLNFGAHTVSRILNIEQ